MTIDDDIQLADAISLELFDPIQIDQIQAINPCTPILDLDLQVRDLALFH